MNKQTAKELIRKYQQGTLTPADDQLLEDYIEQGWIQLEELEDLHQLHERLGVLLQPKISPSEALTQSFHKNLSELKLKEPSPKQTFSWYQIAAAIGVLLVGIGLGHWGFKDSEQAIHLQEMRTELTEMREMLALTMLETESPSERMKAVFMTQEMPDVSQEICTALLHTLCHDQNVNVRLVTLEVLFAYTDNPSVREGLIKAIPYQDSPLVQLAIAEVMVALQESSSVDELKDLLNQEMLPEEVKDQLRKSIEILM